MPDGNNLFDIAADVALAPYIAAEQRADQTRALARQMEVQRAAGVCWSGIASRGAHARKGESPMTRPQPTEQDRANWTLAAYQTGYRHPDDINPYKKFSRSWDAWHAGREDRLTGKPMFDPPRFRTPLLDSFMPATAEAARDALSELLIGERRS